jgi:tripartite-type tricarboxylate transporter receptor subunit TctC
MYRISVGLAVLLAGLPMGAAGQSVAPPSYPSRIITLIVPFPPGGGNDTIARLVAQGLTSALGQQVVVENRGGANGVIAMRQAAKAAPDGHTLIFANSSSTSINIALYANPGYDVRRDFAPIGNIAQMGIGIVSHPDFPAKSVSDLVFLARKQPGKLSFGTSPPGSGSHLSAELFKATTNIDVTLVPYKGASALTTDVLGNHIPVMFSVLPPALGNIQNDKLHVIAVTTPTRMALLPNAPTVAESGLPGFTAVLRYGLLAPAGTPRPIIERINTELRKIVKSKEMLDRLAKEGSDPVVSSPEEYAADMVREDDLWGPLIRKLGIKID